MPALSLCLSTLLAAAPSPHGHDHGQALFEASGHDAYFHGKQGFSTLDRAKNHAFKEFQRGCHGGRIDPRRDEYFCYIYTHAHPTLGCTVFLHTAWQPAVYQEQAHGSRVHRVARPYEETGALRVFTLMHSHPTALPGGEGPSRVDVATASRYRNPDGSYRYLYLINNRGRLIPFKARRAVDPGDPTALAALPHKPRPGLDWVD